MSIRKLRVIDYEKVLNEIGEKITAMDWPVAFLLQKNIRKWLYLNQSHAGRFIPLGCWLHTRFPKIFRSNYKVWVDANA